MGRTRTVARLVVALSVVALSACGDDDTTSTTSTAPPTDTTLVTATTVVGTTTTSPATTTSTPSTSTPSTSTAPAPAAEVMNVYWAWTIPTAPGGSPERLGASQREIMTDDPLTEALQIVISGGPDESEQALGMSTALPTGTRLLGVEIDGDAAVVDLTTEFTQSGGTLGEGLRLAQIVFTATQFDGIERVRFRVNGVDQETVGTHGVEVGDGLTRADQEGVRPAILVESPSPVVAVGSSFTLAGEANTFEATVLYRVLDGESGVVVDDGFTTATAGTGTWGAFSTEVTLPTDAGSDLVLEVYEQSAEDGSAINVVRFPLRIDS